MEMQCKDRGGGRCRVGVGARCVRAGLEVAGGPGRAGPSIRQKTSKLTERLI
jgi:hypothetical protein